ncbi:MAG: hypothetical protein QM638_09905 [Nocardioides sp.]|uniref:hypothetical protein n=1 Tax=Nocardioides sp. TaxID=35761 RepID=UPI0039E335C7
MPAQQTRSQPVDKPRLDIDWVKTIASALAAVSSAVVLSTLGAAGTLIGAAVGSVAATVTAALYTQGLSRSRETVARAGRRLAVTDPNATTVATETTGSTRTIRTATLAPEPLDAEATAGSSSAGGWRERFRTLPWKRISVLSLATFLAVVAIVTVFELVSGRTLSSLVGSDDGGGTTISRITGSGDGSGSDSSNSGNDSGSDSSSDGTTATSDATDDSTATSTSTSDEDTATAEPSEEATSSASDDASSTATSSATSSATATSSAQASSGSDTEDGAAGATQPSSSASTDTTG